MYKPVHFTVGGSNERRLVGPSQNTLAHLARVTADCDYPGSERWPVSRFKVWLADQGVTSPNVTVWERTLPNGRVIGAVKVPAGYHLVRIVEEHTRLVA